jgi:hypothetical protein
MYVKKVLGKDEAERDAAFETLSGVSRLVALPLVPLCCVVWSQRTSLAQSRSVSVGLRWFWIRLWRPGSFLTGIMVTVVPRENSVKEVVETEISWGLSDPKDAADWGVSNMGSELESASEKLEGKGR